MKKIISALLVFCIALCIFSGCSLAPVSEQINNAIEKTKALDEYDVTVSVDCSLSVAGATMSMPQSLELKVKNNEDGKTTYIAKNTISVMGINTVIDVYCDAEWLYVEAFGMKKKIEIEDEIDSEYDFAGEVEDILQTLPEDVFTDVELEVDEEGAKFVELSVQNDVFYELFKATVDDQTDDMSDIASALDDILVTDSKLRITVDNGYVTQYSMSYEMSVSGEDNEYATVSVVLVLDVNAPGKPVEITAPDDLDSYKSSIFDIFG